MWLVLAAASLMGRGQLLAAEEVVGRTRLPRREALSPARRSAPQRPQLRVEDLRDRGGSWWEREHATGDWRGIRGWLDEHGAAVELTYTGEVFSNLHGGSGSDRGTEYRGNLDLIVTFDTGVLGWWPGGTVFSYLQNGHGRGLTDRYVGDIQRISNIDAEDFTQLSEYWFAQELFEGRARVKLGKQDANSDFCALDYGADFVNSSFGVIPTVPLPTFPDPALGGMGMVGSVGRSTLGMGIYDGAPNGGTSGFDTTFDNKGGAFGIVELTLRTSLLSADWHSGAYRIGGWRHSGDIEEISDAPRPKKFAANYGFYLAFDQLLFEESGASESSQGLGVLAQGGWAPGDRNEIARYFGGGLVYTGAVPGRDGDTLGVGVAHARMSDRVRRRDGAAHETVVEVFYKAQLVPWLTLQPDFQFISNPGGDDRNAVVLGLRFILDL